MAREKVTLTLDVDLLEELRALAGARSLSAAVDNAVRAHLSRLRHLDAVDEWLADMEREYGPIPPQTLDWAGQLIQAWESGEGGGRRRAV
jgi:hypothetical protein